MRFWLCFFILMSVVPFAHAKERLRTELAYDHVDITTGFTGASVTLFGVKNGGGEVVSVLLGPKDDVVVRKKSRVLGAWLNRSSLKFTQAPLYYDFAVQDGVSASVLDSHEIGVRAQSLQPSHSGHDEAFLKTYREAYIAHKQAQGLYAKEPSEVQVMGDGFFKIVFNMPADVPIGDYDVKTYILEDARVVAQHNNKLKIAQVGFSSNIYKFAHQQSFFYALICVALAFFAGWLSNKILRKD